MKILSYDRDGYSIWSKRLELGRFEELTGDDKKPLTRTGLLAPSRALPQAHTGLRRTDRGALLPLLTLFDWPGHDVAGSLERCAEVGLAVYCTYCQHGSCFLPSPTPLVALRTENADLAARLGSLTAAHEALKSDYAALKHQVEWFRRQLFGRRSENQFPFDPAEQASLFETLGVEPAAAPVPVEEISYQCRKKKPRGDAAFQSVTADEFVQVSR